MTQLIGLGGQKNASFTNWDINQQYRPGDMVVYNNEIRTTTQNIPAGTAWNPAQWTTVVGGASLPLANGNSNFDITSVDGNVTITANSTSVWTFRTDGTLSLPSGNTTIGSLSGADVILANNSTFAVLSQGTGSSILQWMDDINAPTQVSAVYVNSPVTGGIGDVSVISGSFTWNFDSTGNLVLPLNTFSVNYANGAPVPLGGSYGNSNVVTLMSSFGSNTITTTGNVSVGNITANGVANLGAVGNVRITGGSNGQVLITNGSGVLSFGVPDRANAVQVIGSATAGNFNIMFTGSVGGYATPVVDSVANTFVYNPSTNRLFVENANISGVTNLGAVGNVTITGGSNGQVLATNGTGNLSWKTVSGGGNPTGNDIGVFYSTQTQTNLLPENPMTVDVTQISSNVSIVSGSRITFANSGNRYNIQFSAQLDKTDSGQDTAEIWLSKNGVAEPWTNTMVDVNNNNGKVVPAWNFVVEPSAGDYYELMWYSSDVDLRIYAQAATTRPAIPSLIITVTQC